ncbi:hypothetical protein BST92_11075 [Nonlabens arenilitoris]|uniref:DUF1211 domain-containing membrane protein n=1 Tax=Nonlabens arenilitoris TaxID=1217969 RepID=A0A2S7UDD5_9FLAO|nr:TMEM175 family protein [Nonlabens arenilitoris]PQJ32434.1 hypothetical protein BST92_11075 [Nonlabens arenilitoris]
MNLTYDKTRVNNFTDAVFAIAMTLLVLDLTVPNYRAIQTNTFAFNISQLIPNFIGYTVSFIVIAVYWVSHMNISKHIKHYTTSVLWINIMLLFMVVLMPFTTAFYCKTFYINEPFMVYSGNIIALSLFKYLMVYRIQKDGLLNNPKEKITLQWIKSRDLAASFIWLLAIIVSLKFVILSRFTPILLLPLLKFIDIVYKRKSTRRGRRISRKQKK